MKQPDRTTTERRNRSTKRGAYSGRADYTLTTKVTLGIPLTDEEKRIHRAYQRANNRRSREARRMTIEGRSKMLYDDAKRRAQKEAVPFNITQEWIAERLRAGKCEWTGIAFDLGRHESCRVHKHAPSLDRKDPRKGYTEDNTRVVIWQFNAAKLDFTDADLYEFALAVVRKMFVERCKAEGYDAE